MRIEFVICRNPVGFFLQFWQSFPFNSKEVTENCKSDRIEELQISFIAQKK